MSIVLLLAVIFVIGIPVGALVLILIFRKSKISEGFPNSIANTVEKTTPINMFDSQEGNDMKTSPQERGNGVVEKKQLSMDMPAKPDIEKMIDERRMERAERSAGFCSRCGSPIQQSDIFCPGCGEKVSR
jgi:hypothetical protein